MARGDCNDADAAVYPGAADVGGDGIDSDCGGSDGAEPHVGLSSSSSASIELAVAAAGDGSTVWVGPGTYEAVDISFAGRGIALRSTDGPLVTILDAGGQGRVFIFNSGETSAARVDGFTITGGEAPRGGGIRTNRTSPVLENLVVIGNHASIDGGGISSAFGAPVYRRVIVADNAADNLGGGGLADSSAEVTLEDVLFQSNKALEGGGFYASTATLTMNRVGFVDNVATADGGHGGGAYLSSLTSLSGHNWWFQGNEASLGGGLYLIDTSATLPNLLVMDNRADKGGGMFLKNASVTFQNITVMSNEADTGAGVHLVGSGSPAFIDAAIAYNSTGNVYNNMSSGDPSFSCSSLYAPDGAFNHNLSNSSGFEVGEEPSFIDYDDTGMPVDAHLAIWSPLVDAGCPELTDPDGTVSDIGAYGGPMADAWDRDLDGAPDYFWPGFIEDAPQGFDPADFDCEDTIDTVQVCEN